MFSKITILLVLGVALTVVTGHGKGKMLEKWNEAKEKCMGETTKEELDKALSEKNFPPSMNCFIGCVGIELKWLTNEGGYNKAYFDEKIANAPEQFKSKIEEKSKKVQEALGSTVGKCESGAKLIPMSNEYLKKHGDKVQ